MKINETYKLTIDVNGKILTFTGKIISEDDNFITFVDRYNSVLAYNKRNIISAEEIKWDTGFVYPAKEKQPHF